MANTDIHTYGTETRFKPGVSGNKKGRPKGALSMTTIVKQLLEDEELADKVFARKPSYWKHLPDKNFATAIVIVMMIKAMSGDVRAATWIRQTGYGNKVQLNYDESELRSVQIFDMQQHNRNLGTK